MNFSNTLINVLVLMALAVPGFILKKTKKLDENATKYLVNIIFYICQPMIVIASFQRTAYSGDMLLNMLYAFLIGFVGITVVGIIAMLIAGKVFKDGRERIISFAAAFGNVAFMGIPVISVLLPNNPEAIIYLTVLTVAFNMLSWTLGAYMMSGKKEYVTVKKALLNPPTIAVFIALPLFFLNVALDSRVVTGIKYLGDMVTPLSMTILGIRFADIKLKQLLNDVSVYVISAVKLVLIPALLYVFLRLVNLDVILAQTLYIIFLMPCANNLLLFAEHFDGDTALAAKTVLFSTMLSVATIPLMLLLPL
ncbi:MAG: AEC family transporter [Clostridiales bacterium]|jgi:predicted permease|nr:AEC family transporter [Clostridiales bacterium]